MQFIIICVCSYEARVPSISWISYHQSNTIRSNPTYSNDRRLMNILVCPSGVYITSTLGNIGAKEKKQKIRRVKASKVAREAAPRPPHHCCAVTPKGFGGENVSRRSRSPRFMQPVLLRSEWVYSSSLWQTRKVCAVSVWPLFVGRSLLIVKVDCFVVVTDLTGSGFLCAEEGRTGAC